MSQFRVLLCSSSMLYNQTLAVAFQQSHSFQVVGQVDYSDLLDAATGMQPDVVILRLDDADLLPAVMQLKRHCPYQLPIMIVENPNSFSMADLVKSGVRGCLPLRMLPRQIVNAVDLIVVAGILCLPRINTTITSRQQLTANETGNIQNLTPREREVLSFLGKSLSNQEIAAAMCISESTVKTHLRNSFRKLKVRNRIEALAYLLGADIRPV